MTPDQYCQQKAAACGAGFPYSVMFLPPPRRRALTALHAFCRELDETVTGASDPALAATGLAWWRAEVARLFGGQPQHPVARALAPHLAPAGLTADRLLQVIDGAALDLSQNRYLDYAGLARYCTLVAGVPAEIAAGILGAAQPATYGAARELGCALRLVTILRDVGSDARRGRIYLPVEDLQRFGVRAADLLAARYVDGFEALMRFEAARARATWRAALAALPAAERRSQRAALILGALHAKLLDELERERFRVLHQRIALTPLRELLIAWRTWVLGPAAAGAAR